MSLKICKFQCAGNDILIVPFDGVVENELWRFIAHRKLGIGGDQCFLIRAVHAEQAFLEVEILNQDGTTAGQCLNGMLCLGLNLRESVPSVHQWQVQTATCLTKIENREAISVRVDPIKHYLQAQKNVIFSQEQSWRYNDDVYAWAACDVGNPHAILRVSQDPYQLSGSDFEAICVRFTNEVGFDEGVNVSLMHALRPETEALAQVRIRTFERGAGETLACGSAALASLAVGNRFFGDSSRAQVRSRFDSYEVALEHESGVLMGRPQAVFETTMTALALETGQRLYRQLHAAL